MNPILRIPLRLQELRISLITGERFSLPRNGGIKLRHGFRK